MKFKKHMIFTLVLFVAFILAVIEASTWPLRASILVLVLGGAGAVLLAIQAFLELRRDPNESQGQSGMDIVVDENQKTKEAKRRSLIIWAWLLGLTLGIWLFGFFVAIPVFAFAYPVVHKGRWFTSLVIAIVCFALLYGLFEFVMHLPWPDPKIPPFPWLQNIITGR
ncbi:MAG: tripartite tricarboxylate transporter TctB family protein [Dehalococcoidia bacterium]|nr:tripartite tricarboxylate transporter TctB family protein [Dehalococcoidia bacterium]